MKRRKLYRVTYGQEHPSHDDLNITDFDVIAQDAQHAIDLTREIMHPDLFPQRVKMIGAEDAQFSRRLPS